MHATAHMLHTIQKAFVCQQGVKNGKKWRQIFIQLISMQPIVIFEQKRCLPLTRPQIHRMKVHLLGSELRDKNLGAKNLLTTPSQTTKDPRTEVQAPSVCSAVMQKTSRMHFRRKHMIYFNMTKFIADTFKKISEKNFWEFFRVFCTLGRKLKTNSSKESRKELEC